MRQNTQKNTEAPNGTSENMGQRIKRLREARLWSQSELGERVGVTKVAVSQWETSKEATGVNIRLQTFLRLCEVFNVGPEFLIFGRDRTDRPKRD